MGSDATNGDSGEASHIGFTFTSGGEPLLQLIIRITVQ